MSFILDALKKSEADRQRQNGPALFEVKVAPPRSRLPLWALAIAALLLVNLGIVLWLVLRHPAHATETAALPAAAPVQSAPLPPAAAPAPTAPAPATSAPLLAASQPQSTAPPPSAAPASGGSVPTAAPAAAPQAGTAQPGGITSPAPASAAPAAAANAAGAGSADGGNPADYAPAEAPAAGSLSGHVRRGTEAGVPLYQDAASVPGTQIPQLRLDLHVYAVRPEDRFVMINMHKVHEGDTLPEGVHVDGITPEGAVLSYNGSRFLLPRE